MYSGENTGKLLFTFRLKRIVSESLFFKLFPRFPLADKILQLLGIFGGNPGFTVCIIVIGKFPVFLRITEADLKICPFFSGHRLDLMVCTQHFFTKVYIPVVFFENFSHKSAEICNLSIKSPVVEICHCTPFSEDEYVMLVIFSMTDFAFFCCFASQCPVS